ncbi:Cytidylyltransferase family [Legionella busanensis]|uniref:Cytidylyltransferase family n=1 Tax=Legionella busanensis TaxID=190655 RepID=A0A378JU40_9GAMM|nr:hypothetical protein [Legionella busanensis]STX51712.1 Cytidylyltransferase family [Legionella busanensis]
MLNEIRPFTILFFIILYLTIFLSLYILQKFIQIHPEYSRKFIHILCGLTCLTYPILFNSILSVIIIMGLTIVFFLILRLPYFKQTFNSVFNLRHLSLGEIYFPISIILLFYLAKDNYLLFAIPILILSLADAAASIIGVKYHRIQYSFFKSKKSLEGSVAFLIVSFFCIAVPFFLVNSTFLLIDSLLLAIFLTLLEGACSKGFDNIFLPLCAYLLLHYFFI